MDLTEHLPTTRAERRARDAEAQARREDILAEARLKRQERADEAKRRRKAARGYARTEWWATTRARADRLWHTFVLVGAIVGVNLVAVAGQVTAFHAGLDWDIPAALGAAAVIESIAIYVGWHAHVALIEGDSVMRLRVTSYAIAAGVGILNYHHYAPDWKVDDQAVMFGAASLLSPWLWAIHSRHVHRAQLRTAGLIDPRAPKFSALRWLLHKDETWQALKWAVRHSEQSPAAAILAMQTETTATEAAASVDRTRDDLLTVQALLIRAQSDLISVTNLVMTETAPASAEVTAERPIGCPPEPLAIDPAPVTELVTDPVTSSDQASDRDRPDDQDNREAEVWIRRRMREGQTPRQRDVAERFGFSNGWARLRVQTAKDQMTAKGYTFLPGNRVHPPAEAVTVNGTESDHAHDIPMTAVEVS